MSIETLFKNTEKSFKKSFDWFVYEASLLRGSRARVELVENIKVSYSGSTLLLKEIASLSMLDSRTISIKPWDKTAIPEIEKALYSLDIGGSVKSEQDGVLFSIPTSTQEDKEKFIKMLKEKMEKAKETLRQARDKAWKEIQEMEKEGEISKDHKFKNKESLQKLIEKYEEKIEETEKDKEKNILK